MGIAAVKVTADGNWRIEFTDRGGADIFSVGPTKSLTMQGRCRNAAELEEWLAEHKHPFTELIDG